MPSGDVKPCMFMNSLGNIKQKICQYLSKEKTNLIRKEIQENKCPKCWMNCYSPHSIMQNHLGQL